MKFKFQQWMGGARAPSHWSKAFRPHGPGSGESDSRTTHTRNTHSLCGHTAEGCGLCFLLLEGTQSPERAETTARTQRPGAHHSLDFTQSVSTGVVVCLSRPLPYSCPSPCPSLFFLFLSEMGGHTLHFLLPGSRSLGHRGLLDPGDA